MLIAGGVKPHYRACTRERILTACVAFEQRHQRPIRSSDLNGKDDLPWLVTVHKHLGDIAALRDALNAARSSA